MTNSHFFRPVILTSCLISGCTTIQLENTQADEVSVNVSVIQTRDETQIGIQLKNGLWGQPVTLSEGDAFVISEQGETELLKSSKKGRYGYHGESLENLKSLEIAFLGAVDFPEITPVTLTGQEPFSGQTFIEDDLLTLSLGKTRATKRFLVTEGLCSKRLYRTEKEISTDATDLALELHNIMRKLNRAAGANLTGIVPVTLRIEEQYDVQWPEPFIAKHLAAVDEASFSVDTVDFRFHASIGIKLSDNVFFKLATDNFDDKFCH